ncbi:MAG: cell envelope integrity protein TolA, partial [Acidobacteriaceae bacterium]
PAPSEQPAEPAPPQPEVAQQKPPTPPAQPLPDNNQAHLEAPPMAPQPNFRSGASNPNEALQQAMRQAMQGRSGQYGGDMGQGANPQHQGMQGAVDILSDTMGVDFGPYIQRVIWDTKRSWYPLIPEEARSPINKQGKVLIRFRIMPDGSVQSMQLESPSGDVALDRSAWAGITGASPFPPLPKEFKGPFLELRFYFLYNIEPGEE